jgi:hypothetical protein
MLSTKISRTNETKGLALLWAFTEAGLLSELFLLSPKSYFTLPISFLLFTENLPSECSTRTLLYNARTREDKNKLRKINRFFSTPRDQGERRVVVPAARSAAVSISDHRHCLSRPPPVLVPCAAVVYPCSVRSSSSRLHAARDDGDDEQLEVAVRRMRAPRLPHASNIALCL